jgi:predicted  nucleic acid-binding Zn-ribbon protein
VKQALIEQINIQIEGLEKENETIKDSTQQLESEIAAKTNEKEILQSELVKREEDMKSQDADIMAKYSWYAELFM